MRTVLFLLLLIVGSSSSFELPTGKNLSVPMSRQLNAEQWYEYGWDELPDKVRQAFGLLLITEEIWCDVTDTVDSPIDEYNWFNLSPQQKAAAVFLGYSEEIWCTKDGVWACEPEHPFSKYLSMAWDRLPDDVRAAYEAILITEEIWNDVTGTVDSPIDDYNWFDLSPQQKVAAVFLGYSEEIWCTKDGVWMCDFEHVFSKYHSMGWVELPDDIRRLYKTLLYTRASWDGGAQSPMEEYNWSDLSEEQRAAATTLGYTEEIWCTDLDTGAWVCGGGIEGGITLKVDILTDNYPSDTSWTLMDTLGGGQVAAGGGYAVAGKLYSTEHVVAANSCLEFKIVDKFDDGICCSMGSGSYQVYMDDSLKVSGGEFVSEETQTFGECEGGITEGGQTEGVITEGVITEGVITEVGITLKVDILTDNFPGDTSWTLRDIFSGDQVAAGSYYAVVDKLYSTEHVVQASSCFEFKIYDSYDDGICCSQGSGSYQVYMDNSLKVSGGEFGSEETKTFGECGVTLKVDILTDNFPSDTSWTITDTFGGGQVAAGGGYSVPGEPISTEHVVPANSCFEFTISDKFDDGICCSQGSGSYQVYINNSLKVSGGEFGSEETQTFGECA